MRFEVQPSKVTDARLTVPGDKSVSHRALMLGGIAEGRTHVRGFLAGEDCLATLAAMSDMGVTILRPAPTELVVDGVGLHGLIAPDTGLDLGNSGTAMRLMAGLLSGQNFSSVLSGDASLSSRPMQRVIGPLELMGATIESHDGCPPLTVHGNPELRGIDYTLPVASAQVKSAILLAGLYADGITTVKEPAVTRDHTERMLVTMGAGLERANHRISMRGHQTLHGCDIEVPADLSSASFIILAAVLAERADVLITDVGVNPTRTGVIDILQAMGASIEFENQRQFGAEPIADIRVRSSSLRGGVVDPALVSLAIDEFPVLFVAAAAAQGKTVFSGLAELRVKESDRIAAMAEGLRALGIQVVEVADGATVYGGPFKGGVVESHGDHRVAMSLAIAATIATDTVVINDVAAVNTSFPGFTNSLEQLGVSIR
ncbi:MAG: 3-phosphoshikimate 1-carboxyvinyltransferase [Proteobacteria bacterium]|nr:3-phosphoshikimate 1-carboxyvinyltransferase [Pseudomonadota bacterium]